MRTILFSLLVTVSSLLHAQSSQSESPFLTKPISTNISNVEVKTSGGSITVIGGSVSSTRVEVYIQLNNQKGKAGKEEIQRRLDDNYNLNIIVTDTKVSAIAHPKRDNIDNNESLSISFKIFTPSKITSDLKTSGGSISLNNLSGSQDFRTSGGSLHIDKVSGKMKGRTAGGSIHLDNSKDDIDLATSGGSIHADNSEGNIKLSTSGGPLHLSELKGTITANTSGGSIQADNIKGELKTHTSGGAIQLDDLSCSLETSTSGGNIKVSFKEPGSYVRINNNSGSIDLQLPSRKGMDLKLSGQKISTPSLANFNGKIEKEEVNGKLNGGGIPVTVHAENGTVNLELE